MANDALHRPSEYYVRSATVLYSEICAAIQYHVRIIVELDIRALKASMSYLMTQATDGLF